MSQRAEALRKMQPQLIADVVLYPTEQSGRRTATLPGWGCPCTISKTHPLVGYDAWPLLGDEPLSPGESRRLGFVFLSPEGLEAITKAGSFYLWEGGFIGERPWSLQLSDRFAISGPNRFRPLRDPASTWRGADAPGLTVVILTAFDALVGGDAAGL